MMFVDSYCWRTETFSGSKWHELLASYSRYHFSFVVVGVSGSSIVSRNTFGQLHLRRSVVIICRPTRTNLHVHEGCNMKPNIHSLPTDHAVTDSGVPYNVTVRASTAVGKGEPVSIVVFAEQQGRRCMCTLLFTNGLRSVKSANCWKCNAGSSTRSRSSTLMVTGIAIQPVNPRQQDYSKSTAGHTRVWLAGSYQSAYLFLIITT